MTVATVRERSRASDSETKSAGRAGQPTRDARLAPRFQPAVESRSPGPEEEARSPELALETAEVDEESGGIAAEPEAAEATEPAEGSDAGEGEATSSAEAAAAMAETAGVAGAAPAAKEAAGEGETTEGAGAAASASDAKLNEVIGRAEAKAVAQKKHAPAAKKVADARGAAVPPTNERQSVAQSRQVKAIEGAPVNKPEPDSFLTLLRAKLEEIAPKNLEEMDEFKSSGKAGQMKGELTSNVEQQKGAATSEVRARAGAEPDTASVPEQPAVPLASEPAAPKATAINAGDAVPDPKPGEEVSLEGSKEKAEETLAQNNITETQLEKANEPQFSAVLTAKQEIHAHADVAPGDFRQQETAELDATRADAIGSEAAAVAGMEQSRARGVAQVGSNQQSTKSDEEAKRLEVANHIDAIYEETTKAVQSKLESIDAEVNSRFDEGEAAARREMENHVNDKKNEYKRRRYDRLGGSVLWLKDKLMGLPDEVQVFYDEAREIYLKRMDVVIVDIADIVDTRLKEAKDEVARGRQRIQEYVDGLPKDLKQAGKRAQRAVASRFDELEKSVDAKKEQLVDSLAQRYKEARDKADEKLKEMRAEDKGLVDAFLDGVLGVIKILLDFKNRLVQLVGEAMDAIMLIIADPIGFLGNLLKAIKQGIGQFVDNIWTHLKEGFLAWLFGALGEAGITMPSEFSVKSIFGLVLQLLGITPGNLRKKAVALIGERNVELIEQVWEFVSALISGGVAGLWEHIKEYLSDLKDTIIAQVQEWVITQIIKAAVLKLVSMFNPVGALIQAILMIYNTVTFFIERINQIMALVKAIVSSVTNIAKGMVGEAANWIEKSLARAIPVMISFLAALLGIGGIAAKIRGIIQGLQEKVDKAIDKMIAKVIGAVGKLFGKKKATAEGKKEEEEGPPRSPEEEAKWQRGVAAVRKDIEQMGKDGLTTKEIQDHVPAWKSKHGFRSMSLSFEGNNFALEAEMSPRKKVAEGSLAAGDLPKTEVTYGGMHGVVGGLGMKASPLTKVGDAGTKPSVESVHWLRLSEPRRNKKRLYVQGHLLNMLLGGPGNKPENLTPFTYSANATHQSQVESKLKEHVFDKKDIVEYEVLVHYPSRVDLSLGAKRLKLEYAAEEGDLATHITTRWRLLQRSSDDPKTLVPKTKWTKDTIDNVPPWPQGLEP